MSARIRVDPGGRLGADPELGTQLRPRSGAFQLLPSNPDFLLALRSPPLGGQSDRPRVVLVGDASGFPLSDLIAFLGQSRWTGTLRVHSPGGERAVTLQEGEVRAASSEDPTDRLSEVLVRMGHASRSDVEEALRDNPPSRVGRVLVERGLLQSHDLWACVSHQVSEIFQTIVLAREGAFTLVDQEPEDRMGPSLQLSTQSLLMDAIRKIDELQHFRQRIPHGQVYVTRRRPSDGKLKPDEDRLLGLASGQRTVVELAQAATLSEFDATKILFRLLEGGYATVSELPPTETAARVGRRTTSRSPESDPAVRVVNVFQANFGDLIREVSNRGHGPEFLAAANAALRSRTLSESPVVEALQLDARSAFDASRLLDSYLKLRTKLGSEPAASLRQALSDVMLFLLFQASDLLGERKVDEELAHRAKELLATLG